MQKPKCEPIETESNFSLFDKVNTGIRSIKSHVCLSANQMAPYLQTLICLDCRCLMHVMFQHNLIHSVRVSSVSIHRSLHTVPWTTP